MIVTATSDAKALKLNQTSSPAFGQQVEAPYPEGVAPTVVYSPALLQYLVISDSLIGEEQSSLEGWADITARHAKIDQTVSRICFMEKYLNTFRLAKQQKNSQKYHLCPLFLIKVAIIDSSATTTSILKPSIRQLSLVLPKIQEFVHYS
jgi:hypothetical protein